MLFRSLQMLVFDAQLLVGSIAPDAASHLFVQLLCRGKLEKENGRPLTDSEIFGFAQINSEHVGEVQQQQTGIGHGRTGNYGQETACQSRYQAEDTHQNEKDV